MSALAQAAPSLDFAGLSALVTAVGGVLLTLGTLFSNRQRRIGAAAKDAVADLERRDEQYRVAMRHIRALEDTLTHLGDTPPARPLELTAAWWAGRHAQAEADTANA